MIDRDAHRLNRAAWNAMTPVHNARKRDQAAFLRDGGSTLFPEEIDLLGDVRGLRLLHLCCNSGQDTVSLAARGALATGVDISDEAIAFARQLSADSGLPATFHRADAYDWLPVQPPASFERVFLSYGAIDWLSDLGILMSSVQRLLTPGGRLVVLDFHPLAYALDERGQLHESLFSGPIDDPQGLDDYVAEAAGALSPMGTTDPSLPRPPPQPIRVYPWNPMQVVDRKSVV